MSDHTTLKITPEQALTGVILKAEPFEGKFGPSYGFDIDSGAGIYHVIEGKTQVDRQLVRIGLNIETMIGRTLKFWKKPMEEDPLRGYLNIDLMDAPRGERPSDKPAFVPPKEPTAPPRPADPPIPVWLEPETRDQRIKQQAEDDLLWCWNKAWSIMAPKIEGAGGAMADPMTIQAVQAAAVGMMIRLEHARKGG